MALWAMGDMHLNYDTARSMDIYGRIWKNHDKKIDRNCRKLISDEDTFLIAGDHSMGNKLPSCMKDLEYIASLPGRKILLRGNHDQFWDVKKTAQLNRRFEGRLLFLQNNYFPYREYALVGSKGYCYEGKDTPEHAAMIVQREAERLRLSFEAARADGYAKFIMFLHFPPTNIIETESIFTRLAEEYGASKVIYAHCHGEPRWDDSLKGVHNGVEYRLVSGDYLNFRPEQILAD